LNALQGIRVELGESAQLGMLVELHGSTTRAENVNFLFKRNADKQFMDDVYTRLVKVSKPGAVVGCTKDEIKAIKWAQGTTWLPRLYEEYLLRMGGSWGLFLTSPNWHYPGLSKNKARAIEMLKDEEAPLSLPSDAFVLGYDGPACSFYFFHTIQRSNDPVIFKWTEISTEFTELLPFSTIVIKSIESFERHFAKYGR
jgi:hypothetical protein